MTLDFGARVETVEREAAPVVVSVVGVGGELKENFRTSGCVRGRGPNDKEEIAFGGASAFVGVGAAAIFGAQADFVISSLPIGRKLETKGCRPVATVRGGIFGNGMLCPWNVVCFENSSVGRAEAGDFQSVCRRGGGDVEGNFVAGGIADFSSIAFDKERFESVGVVAVKKRHGKEKGREDAEWMHS